MELIPTDVVPAIGVEVLKSSMDAAELVLQLVGDVQHNLRQNALTSLQMTVCLGV
jgi:hypothetical protein